MGGMPAKPPRNLPRSTDARDMRCRSPGLLARRQAARRGYFSEIRRTRTRVCSVGKFIQNPPIRAGAISTSMFSVGRV